MGKVDAFIAASFFLDDTTLRSGSRGRRAHTRVKSVSNRTRCRLLGVAT